MDKWNWSRYNFLFESSKFGKLLYNSFTNSFLRLNDELFKDLNSIADNKSDNEVYKNLFSDEELNYFKDNYFLTQSDESLVEQMHFQSLHRIYDKKHLILTIAPTQFCNFSCTYCYEKWRTPGRMSDETSNALIQYLKDQKRIYGLETICLTWYGGEPLIEHERIKSLGEQIKELNINIIESDIITNGYLFDEKRIKILSDLNIDSVQITLDGFKDVHDVRRPLLNGGGTFDKIIANLDNFYSGEYKDKMSIALRVNIDKYSQIIKLCYLLSLQNNI